MARADRVASLQAAADAIAATIETKTAEWESGGGQPSYSIGGRSVSWPEWLDTMLRALKAIEEQIQLSSGPGGPVFSRGRA